MRAKSEANVLFKAHSSNNFDVTVVSNSTVMAVPTCIKSASLRTMIIIILICK